jgi:K+/H+ antiporter YhaU regulatory subunit KhtT
LEIPRNVIERRIADVRADTQTTHRALTIPRSKLGEFNGLQEMKIENVLVEKHARADGRSPRELNLRGETGALVVGVRRDGKLLETHDPSERFLARDTVYLVGTTDEVQSALPYFRASDDAEDVITQSGTPSVTEEE